VDETTVEETEVPIDQPVGDEDPVDELIEDEEPVDDTEVDPEEETS